MNKQMQQEQRAQHDSQTRTPAECGHDAASLSVLAAEDPTGSSDEQSEQGVTDVPMADWEDLPADHGYVQDSDYQMLSAPPSLTAVDAVPSAAAMGTDASVGNVTAPDTMLAEVAAVEPTVAVSSPTGADTVLPGVAAAATTAAEAVHDGVAAAATTAAEAPHDNVAAPINTAAEAVHDDAAAPITTAAEASCADVAVLINTAAQTVHDDVALPTTTAAEAVLTNVAAPINTAAEAVHHDVAAPITTAADTVLIDVAAGGISSTEAPHADEAGTTAAIDTSAPAPLAVDMEPVLAQQSGNSALDRQQNPPRTAAQAGDAAAAAADSGTGGYESRHDGGHRVADKYSTTEGRMAAATGGYGHIQQPSGEHVGLGFAEPSKMGSEPSASLPGPLWQGPPSICLPFPLLPLPLLPFSASMASRGPPAFVPMSPAAIAASVDAKQEEVARRARLAQEVAEKAAQEAAALQRVLGGKQTCCMTLPFRQLHRYCLLSHDQELTDCGALSSQYKSRCT